MRRRRSRFDDDGLVPCVAQDWRTGEVLTLAYMNAEALDARARPARSTSSAARASELWHKGETSGNVLRLRQLRYDCDGDALSRWSSRPAPPATPASAPASTATSKAGGRRLDGRRRRRAGRRPRGAAGARAHAARASRPAPRRLLHGGAARRPGRGSATRCARRPTRSLAPPRGSPTSGCRGGSRRPLPPRGAAALARPAARRRAGGAQWPSRAERRRRWSRASTSARELARDRERDPGLAHASSTTARRRSRRS